MLPTESRTELAPIGCLKTVRLRSEVLSGGFLVISHKTLTTRDKACPPSALAEDDAAPIALRCTKTGRTIESFPAGFMRLEDEGEWYVVATPCDQPVAFAPSIDDDEDDDWVIIQDDDPRMDAVFAVAERAVGEELDERWLGLSVGQPVAVRRRQDHVRRNVVQIESLRLDGDAELAGRNWREVEGRWRGIVGGDLDVQQGCFEQRRAAR